MGDIYIGKINHIWGSYVGTTEKGFLYHEIMSSNPNLARASYSSEPRRAKLAML